MHTNVNNIISKLKDIDAKISNINNFEIVNENVDNIEMTTQNANLELEENAR